MMRFALAASLMLAAQAASTQAPSEPVKLDGWWRAAPTHDGETSEFYLHFSERNGKPAASFSIPHINADDSAVGPYSVEKDKVSIPALRWTLDVAPDGQSLSGVLPPDLVPVHRLDARFERSGPPPALTEAKPSNPAPKPLWQARVDGPVYGPLSYSPATDSILIGTDRGALTALDRRTGKSRWTARLEGPIRSAAAIAGDAIYVTSDKIVAKLRAADGKTIWTKSFTGTLAPRRDLNDPQSRWDHYGPAPVIADGLVLAASRDGCVYVLATSSGALQQRICSKDTITGTPVTAGGKVFFASFDHHVYAARLSDGAIAWQADVKEAVPGDLALSDGAVLAGSRSYDFAALDATTGKPRWNRYLWFTWIDSAPVRDGNHVLVGSSDAQRVFALNGHDGRPAWSSFIGGWAWARPAATPRVVYAGAVGTTMGYVGRRAGGLAAIDRKTGKLLWLFKPPSDPKAVISGFASGPVVAREQMFAADLEGNVYAFKAP